MTAPSLAGLSPAGLDPEDWPTTRAQGHRMLDRMFDYIEHVRDRPVWQPMPSDVRAHFQTGLPEAGQGLAEVCAEFTAFIEPYATGNVHPGFMGWVHGGGTVAGLVAEMLAGGLNANCGGRDHAPIAVEQQITQWLRVRFGLPSTASGLFVTGTSMGNLIALWVARTAALGLTVRAEGLQASGAGVLRAYASSSAHGCVAQAMDLSGLGTDALRLIPVEPDHRMDVTALRCAIHADRDSGLRPFLVVATAGTVNVGAIDDLAAIADFCAEEGLWFHIDGAFGALAAFSKTLAPRLKGMERAGSIAFDFHKWGQVPYDAGFVLVRDGEAHRAAFSSPADYLARETRGLAGGDFWPCDYGPDLSRGFRALKTWFTLKTYGAEGLGAVVDHTCAMARVLERRIAAEPRLKLMAPVLLNIVCFRYICDDADRINAAIVMGLHESGLAAPSTTTIDGRRVIRAAIMNHRTMERDIDIFLDAVLALGAREASR